MMALIQSQHIISQPYYKSRRLQSNKAITLSLATCSNERCFLLVARYILPSPLLSLKAKHGSTFVVQKTANSGWPHGDIFIVWAKGVLGGQHMNGQSSC